MSDLLVAVFADTGGRGEPFLGRPGR